MKLNILFGAVLALGFGTNALAESSVTLSKVHLCCDACVKGANESLKGVEGVSMKADKDAGTLTLTGPSMAAVQKGADAVAAGGYFGKVEKGDFKAVAKTGAQNKTVDSMIVAGAHLCCPGCVKAVDRAVKATAGATGHTAKKNATTFVVNGKFNDQKFFEALQAEGLSGRITDKAGPEPAASAKGDH